MMNQRIIHPFFRFLLAAAAVMMTVGAQAQDVGLGRYEQLKNMKGKDLIDLGIKYVNEKNMPDSALLCFTLQANKRFNKRLDKKEHHWCAMALNYLGQMYYDYFIDYQKSFGFYCLAEEFCLKHNVNEILPEVHNNMAGLHNLKGSIDYDREKEIRVIHAYKKAYNEALEYNNGYALSYLATNLASTGFTWNLVDSVKDELSDFVTLRSNPKNKEYGYRHDFCMAVLEYNEKNVDKALYYLDHALATIFNGKNPKLESVDSTIVNDLKIQILFREGRDDEALNVADKSIEIAQRTDNHICFFDTYNYLHNYYKEKGDEKLAMKYELLYLRNKDFIVNESKLADMEQVKFLFEIEKLNQEAEAMAMRDQFKSLILCLIGIFTFLVVSTLLLLYRKYRQVKEKNSQLFQKVQKQLAEIEEKKALIAQADTLQAAQTEGKPKYLKNAIDETVKSELLHRIFMVMESSEEVYSNDFSLSRLAELVDANPNYVSQVINEKYNGNFNALVNEYRIREACRRINDQKHYGNQTLDGIAQSVGIRARSTFVAAFKKFTGMTPSAYQKLAKSQTIVS